MSRTAITPARSVTLRIRPSRSLAAGLAAVVVAGGAAIGFSSGAPVAPARPNAAPAAPITFGDPPVAKGSRGGKADPVAIRVFGDPPVRKGAGGRASSQAP